MPGLVLVTSPAGSSPAWPLCFAADLRVLLRDLARPGFHPLIWMISANIASRGGAIGLVAVGADPHAYAGSTEADATAIVIASVLDITFTRSVSV